MAELVFLERGVVLKKYFIVLFCLFVSNFANANCSVGEARITQFNQYFDGNVFVEFSKHSTCNCEIKGRLAFQAKDPDTQFLQSMILLAYTTGATVSAWSDSDSCIHGNTNRLTAFKIHSN